MWFTFSPRRHHAMEEVAKGRRVSLALFSPRSWRRIPVHALAELHHLSFYPPGYAGSVEAKSAEVESKDEDPQAPEVEPQELLIPSPQEEAILQEWCALQEVSLPYVYLDSSDGQVTPLSPGKRMSSTLRTSYKASSLPRCLISEGPRRIIVL